VRKIKTKIKAVFVTSMELKKVIKILKILIRR
jgi:hypothetical protein